MRNSREQSGRYASIIQTLADIQPSAWEIECADRLYDVIVFLRGSARDGRPFYAYLAVPPSRLLAFEEARVAGAFRPDDYGEILECGPTHEPPEAVRRYFEERYGVRSECHRELENRLECLLGGEDA